MGAPPVRLPAHKRVTYGIRSPFDTHTRPADCDEVDCAGWRNGWVTVVDESTALGAQQAAFIRRTCVRDSVTLRPDVLGGRRRYTETTDTHPMQDGTGSPAGTVQGLTEFRFPPGQPCFREHRVPVGRPELYIVRDGDHRGNPTGTIRTHTRPEHWVEDFAEHQQALHDAHERG